MRSLLLDIGRTASAIPPRPTDEVREVREAVLAILRLLIGTRRGTVWPARDFGIDDPMAIFHDYPGSVEAFRSRLERAIRRHEPRLQSPVVRHVPSADLLLRLDVEGVLVVGGRAVPVRFTSRIDGAGRTELT